MPTYSNLGFEFEDNAEGPGFASSWTYEVTAQRELMALYGNPPDARPLQEFDSFETEWADVIEPYIFVFNPNTDLIAPIYDSGIGTGNTREDFEEGWSSNQSYAWEMGSTSTAVYDPGTPEEVEDFNEEWSSNQSYSFVMGSTTAALFPYDLADEPVEKFEEGWSDNFNYWFVMPSTSTAVYDGSSPENFEDFEEVWGAFNVQVDYANQRFMLTAHGLLANDLVMFKGEDGGGLMPFGMQADTPYYVVAAPPANTFQVSATLGGAALVLSPYGSGVLQVRRDPSRYWSAT